MQGVDEDRVPCRLMEKYGIELIFMNLFVDLLTGGIVFVCGMGRWKDGNCVGVGEGQGVDDHSVPSRLMIVVFLESRILDLSFQ